MADARAHNDIAQLQGLCDAMDEQAFLPLRGDELTNLEMARRIMNFSDLAVEIAVAAEKLRVCSRKGVKETPQKYGGGTYFRIGSYTPWLGFNAKAWLNLGVSPLWVNFYYYPAESQQRLFEIRQKLLRFRSMQPQRYFEFEGHVSVPIFLRAGVEKDKLVEDAVQQLRELAAELDCLERAASGG
jgi:hypothetical protein